MNENKPVTAEEISRTIGLLNSMVECGESHSEISSQMVSNALVATQQLTAENERLRGVFEELLQSRYADVDPPNKKNRLDYWRTKAGINLTHKD